MWYVNDGPVYHTYYSIDVIHTLGNSTVLDFGFNHLNAIIFQIKVNFAPEVSRDKKKLGSKYIIFLLEPERMVGIENNLVVTHSLSHSFISTVVGIWISECWFFWVREKGGLGDKPPGAIARTNNKLYPHIGESGVQPHATFKWEVSDFTTAPHTPAFIRMSHLCISSFYSQDSKKSFQVKYSLGQVDFHSKQVTLLTRSPDGQRLRQIIS